VLVAVVASLAVWSSALSGPGLVLTVVLVGVVFGVGRALLTVTHLGRGPVWQVGTLLVAAAVAAPVLVGGTTVYLAAFGERVDAVVTEVSGTERTVVDPASGRELGTLTGDPAAIGIDPAGPGAVVAVLAKPQLGMDPVAADRAPFGLALGSVMLAGWLAGAAVIAAAALRRRS
jgi:hypothetical protein